MSSAPLHRIYDEKVKYRVWSQCFKHVAPKEIVKV